jgi:hypothetical protein
MWHEIAAKLKVKLHHAADVVGSYTGKVTGTQRLEVKSVLMLILMLMLMFISIVSA